MDLTAIPGIGPAYSERLREAGVDDVAALAAADDLDAIQARSGIPRARLEAFRDEAQRLAAAPAADDEPDLGIATEGISHDVGETLRQTLDDLRTLAESRWREVREHAEHLTSNLTSKLPWRDTGRA